MYEPQMFARSGAWKTEIFGPVTSQPILHYKSRVYCHNENKRFIQVGRRNFSTPNRSNNNHPQDPLYIMQQESVLSKC